MIARPPDAARPGRATAILRLAASFLALVALHATPPPARASSEEFSTFDVLRAEGDDEAVIDHVLTRPPEEWRDEWEHAPQAFRTSQGCMTSGEWYVRNDLKVQSPLGRRARFGLVLDQVEDDYLSYQNLDLWFLFPQCVGTLGAMFRPSYDKSRQDFALMWETGADSTANQLRLVYGLEDLFNNLWAWRQTQVGTSAEPYERHPWEPAFKAALRRARWRFAAEGRWLTLARQHVDGPEVAGEHVRTLWGTWGTTSLEGRALGFTWDARTENRQARSTDHPTEEPSGDARDTRRMWCVELGARRALPGRVRVEGRWAYTDRRQSQRQPLPDELFHSIDRVLQIEARWAARPDLSVRLGGLYDRVGVHEAGAAVGVGQGTRKESRAYVGLMARFGRVSLSGVEGIELDPEPYPVWHHHDKGFLQLQTRF